MSLPALREQFYLQAAGGVDLIKDDEILFENPLTPMEKRIEICLEAAEQAKKETGQKLLYAVNLTGPTSKLAAQAKKAIAAGANALLFNVLAYGFDVLHELSSDPEINDSDYGSSCHGRCDISVTALWHIALLCCLASLCVLLERI